MTVAFVDYYQQGGHDHEKTTTTLFDFFFFITPISLLLFCEVLDLTE